MNYPQLTLRERNLIWLMLGLLVPGLIYVYALSPTWVKYQAQLQALTSEEQHLKQINQLADQQALQSKGQALMTQIEDLEAMIPPEPLTYELLYSLNAAAKEAGLALTQVEFALDANPGDLGSPKVTALTVQMKIKGSYPGFRKFIGEVQSFKRLTKIRAYDIKGGKVLEGVIKVTSYSYPLDPLNLPYKSQVPPVETVGKSNLFE